MAAPKHNAMGYLPKGKLFTNIAVDGETSLNMLLLPNEQFEQPQSGAMITISDTTNTVIIDPGVTLAALTVNMPVRPHDGKSVRITIRVPITLLSHAASGGDFLQNPFPSSTSTVGTSGEWYYRISDTTWYPVANRNNQVHLAAAVSSPRRRH